MKNRGWLPDAPCDVDRDLWSPVSGHSDEAKLAKSICLHECPVLAECARLTLDWIEADKRFVPAGVVQAGEYFDTKARVNSDVLKKHIAALRERAALKAVA